jgi:hypothetical protein
LGTSLKNLESAAEDSGREREQGLDEPEKGLHRYADQPQRKHQKPNDRKKKQSQDSYRPTYDQQKQPQDKFNKHRYLPLDYTTQTPKKFTLNWGQDTFSPINVVSWK